MPISTWKLDDTTATDQHMQCGVGGALDEERELWQLWAALDDYHINWVAAYREQARIDTAMQELKQIGGNGGLFDIGKLRTTLDRLYESREADPVHMPGAAQEIRRNLRIGAWK